MDQSGNPRRNDSIFMASEQVRGISPKAYTHVVKTDDEGHFLARGLEPGATYYTRYGASFSIGSGGLDREVELKW